jgi:hypothetical protein
VNIHGKCSQHAKGADHDPRMGCHKKSFTGYLLDPRPNS